MAAESITVPKRDDVFCTMGHGCDIISEARRTVPPNCKYITIQACGTSSIDLPKIYVAFGDPLMQIPLMYPDLYKDLLNEYFQFGNGDLRIVIHNTDDSYQDAKAFYYFM